MQRPLYHAARGTPTHPTSTQPRGAPQCGRLHSFHFVFRVSSAQAARMKIVTIIARILLGLAFVVFGLNGFLHFLGGPMPPPESPAGKFFAVTEATGYMKPVFALQFFGGLLVLLGIYVPLGLTILAPIIVNIFIFHICMGLTAPAVIAPGIIVAVLEIFLIGRYWANFRGLVQR
jgi:putative oxidoreductase